MNPGILLSFPNAVPLERIQREALTDLGLCSVINGRPQGASYAEDPTGRIKLWTRLLGETATDSPMKIQGSGTLNFVLNVRDPNAGLTDATSGGSAMLSVNSWDDFFAAR